MRLLQPSCEAQRADSIILIFSLGVGKGRTFVKVTMRKWQKQGLKPRASDYCYRALLTTSFCLIWFSRPCGKELQLEHESGFSLVKIVIDWALPSVRITSFNSQNNSVRLQLLPPFPKWGNWGAESLGHVQGAELWQQAHILYLCSLLPQYAFVAISVVSRRLSLGAV